MSGYHLHTAEQIISSCISITCEGWSLGYLRSGLYVSVSESAQSAYILRTLAVRSNLEVGRFGGKSHGEASQDSDQNIKALHFATG